MCGGKEEDWTTFWGEGWYIQNHLGENLKNSEFPPSSKDLKGQELSTVQLNKALRQRLIDILVPGFFLDQFYRVGREVNKNKVDFFFTWKC